MHIRRAITGVAVAALLWGSAATASADTVYMKNGRIIRSSSVRVEGDRVFVGLYDGEVAFPLDAVDRIVEDAETEPAPTRPQATAVEPGPDAAQAEPASADTSGGDEATGANPAAGDAAAGADEPPAPAPEETRAYWQNRIRPLNEQLARMDAELASLRTRTGAAVQAQISRVETQRSRVQAQLDEINREARRLGVPPGWLR